METTDNTLLEMQQQMQLIREQMNTASEKILRERLSGEADQMKYVDKLLDELSSNDK